MLLLWGVRQLAAPDQLASWTEWVGSITLSSTIRACTSLITLSDFNFKKKKLMKYVGVFKTQVANTSIFFMQKFPLLGLLTSISGHQLA
jgi:hypothetical protein